MFRTASLLIIPLALAGCDKAAIESDNPQTGGTSAASTVAAAPAAAKVPAQCAACHSAEPGKHGIGPSLAGVFGRQAGSAPGYTYSAAMKSSGLTWDEAALNKFLDHPMQTVPGTKMVFAGLKDPSKRAEVITQLKAL